MQTNQQISMDYEPQDICESRHGGNENSVVANPDSEDKARMRVKLLTMLCVGNMCCHDLSDALGVGANFFSGRLTAMKNKYIAEVGKCQHGSPAAVWEINEKGRAEVLGL
jgi:hypothetical protein